MNETTPAPAGSQSLPQRVVRWTQKLLDLSLRNRMLNVRDVKQVLPLACRDVARLEDQLASDETVSIAFGDPTENFLVSGCTPDETKRRLTTLFRCAKSDLEESGVNTLFLAIGFLHWKVAPKDEKQYRAPLLLMPVRLVRKGVSDYRLARFDEDTVVNATLLELLRSQYRVTVPDVDPPPLDAHGVDVPKVLESFRAAVKDLPGWEVVRELALGQFSFGKFVMWKDLSGRLNALRQHPLVDHLVRGGGVFDDGVKVFPPEEVAKNIQPAELFCPLSADSSQLAAVPSRQDVRAARSARHGQEPDDHEPHRAQPRARAAGTFCVREEGRPRRGAQPSREDRPQAVLP